MRYMNPGFKDWFSVINDSSSLTETTDSTKTKTGIAFFNTKPYSNFLLFDFPANNEIWIKFDFFAETYFFYFGEPYNSNYYSLWNGFSLNLNTTDTTVMKYIKGVSSQVGRLENSITRLKINGINSILLHLKWADSTNGFMDLQINDYFFDRIEDTNLTPLRDKAAISFQSSSNRNSVSNLIISDETVSIKEQLVPLQISGVDTDMTFDSETGIYTASEVNQSLLASVNVADLISDFGGSSKATGVAVVGNPAYRTAEGLATFTALTKKNNIVTEHSAANIPTDSNSVVANSFKIDSDTTITDLQNMQIGFKVGE